MFEESSTNSEEEMPRVEKGRKEELEQREEDEPGNTKDKNRHRRSNNPRCKRQENKRINSRKEIAIYTSAKRNEKNPRH